MAYPKNGLFVLPDGPKHASLTARVHDALNRAANFAFANRMMLATMAIAGLQQACEEFKAEILYDAPHNYWWRDEIDGELIPIIARVLVRHVVMMRLPNYRSRTQENPSWFPVRWEQAVSFLQGGACKKACLARVTERGGLWHEVRRCEGMMRSLKIF